MKTEHLQNVHAGWVAAGWLVAAAVTSLVLIALAGIGVVEEGGIISAGWTILAVLIGFYIGGMFTGFLSMDAPILHGIAIGIFSLVAWLVLNLLATSFGGGSWQGLSPTATAALLLLQLAAAVGGAWTGHVIATRGGPEMPG